MTTQPDLEDAAERMAAIVDVIPDDALGRPTPCAAYSVGDLLDHVGGAAIAFAAAAKTPLGAPPPADAANLGAHWRTRITADVRALVDAWRESGAWQGMTGAGGIDLPGEVAGMVALDELIVHAWDLAVATGQPAAYDGPELPSVLATVQGFRPSGIEGLFGPEVAVPADAPLLDRILGVAGRDPGWEAPR